MIEKETTLKAQPSVDSQREKARPLRALIGMTIRPKRTFQALNQRTRTGWWVPAMLMVAVIVATTYTYTSAFAHIMYQQQLMVYEQMPEQDRGLMPEPEFRMTPTLTMVIRGGGKFLSTVVTWLVWAGTLTLAASLLGAPSLSFGRALALYAWSSVPIVIRGIAQSVYMAATKTPIYNAGLSGLIIDQAPPPMVMGPQRRMPAIPTQGEVALASVLGHLDLFTLWHLGLLVMGLMICARWRRNRALLTVIGIALIVAAAGGGLAMLGGAFGRFRLF